jgi:hypothetical protein
MLAIQLKVCFNHEMNSTLIIQELGGSSAVASLCETTPQAVSQWFGTDPKTGKKREIPKARLMYLQAVRPNVFRQPQTSQGALAPEDGGVTKS